MLKFEDLSYFGSTFTCFTCNVQVYFSNYSRIRLEVKAEFIYGYQCQECGAFKMSEFGIPYAEFLTEKCDCGGQFRRDKPIFCASCKYNKTELNENG